MRSGDWDRWRNLSHGWASAPIPQSNKECAHSKDQVVGIGLGHVSKSQKIASDRQPCGRHAVRKNPWSLAQLLKTSKKRQEIFLVDPIRTQGTALLVRQQVAL